MSRGSFFTGLAVVVLLIVGLVGWRLITNTGDDANACLLYTSDAADDLLCVDLGEVRRQLCVRVIAGVRDESPAN